MSRFQDPPKKRLGQHFLHDNQVISNIVLAIDPKPGDTLVEIGPGQGAITFPLLRKHGVLTVIEFDRDLINPLSEAAQRLGEMIIVHNDVLQVNFNELANKGKIRLIGNLPYNISTPILFHALEYADTIVDMHFMLQKEVVDRMAATPGSKTYGRLSVMLQARCTVIPLFPVSPNAFRPPPKVDSAVVRLIPKPSESIGITDPSLFERVVREAFGQRRKTLRNALAKTCTGDQILAAGINPETRAEQLSTEQFITLANDLSKNLSAQP